jgi:tRNA 2-thiouridine synthesizing protein A
MNDVDHVLDARGKNCPLPILEIRKTLKAMETGEVVQMLATDPGSTNDMKSFCNQTGHELLSSEQQGAEYIFMVRKI